MEDYGLLRTTDAVMTLLAGDDPAVYVVRESDLPEVVRDEGAWWDGDEFAGDGMTTPERKRKKRDAALVLAARHEAVARAIEAEAVVDPVEQKARELWESTIAEGARVADWEDAHEDARNQFRILARREGQAEAFDEGWKARASRDPLHHPDRDHTAPPPPNGLNPYRQEAGR